MARATPIGSGGRGPLDIFLNHQFLFDEVPRSRSDRFDISRGVRIALKNRSPRVAGRTPLFGAVGKRDIAARKFMHGTLTKAACSQGPAAIGAERRRHHWR